MEVEHSSISHERFRRFFKTLVVLVLVAAVVVFFVAWALGWGTDKPVQLHG